MRAWFLTAAYAATGALALAWFLMRVLPKPSRASYPCQRLAFPLASSFVLWVVGLTGALFAFRRAGQYVRHARYAVAALCAGAVLTCTFWVARLPDPPADAAWTPSDPPNAPVGVAKGINPGRVVWAHDPDATRWDGSANYWWSDANTDQAVVDRMLSASLRRLADATTDAEAWEAIFRHFNRTHGRGDVGYKAGEGIAIKINMNVAGSYTLTNGPISSPQVVHALLAQLVGPAGVTEAAITVYDASRCITDAIVTPCRRDFPAVKFVDKLGQNGRIAAAQDPAVPIHYADPQVGESGVSRLPSCVTQSAYLINLALLRGHSLAGVTLGAKNYFGSVWRPSGGFSPSNIHASVDRNRAVGTRNSLVDLMGHAHLGGKALLFMVDALYAAVNQSSSKPARWQSTPFDNDWTSSLFVSQDGVALDSVALDFCRSEPLLEGQVTGQGVDNYLHEAALADNPPSGAVYDPEGDGTRLGSLGVHEHWNNAEEKRYSRNLGTGQGIELVRVPSVAVGFRRGDANADGRTDLSDAVTVLLHLFRGRQLACEASADANDSAALDVADAVKLLGYLFAGESVLPAPFAACGPDPTPDTLRCDSFTPCE